MTIANTENTIREAGNGVKTAFDFPFKIYNVTDVKVYKITNATEARELMVYGDDYTVSISQPVQTAEGGTVTFLVAPTSDEDSFIERDLPYTQATNIPAVGGIREEQIEKGLDKLCILILQLLKKVQLSLKLVSSSTFVDLTVPDPESGKILAWKADETGLENVSQEVTETQYPGAISAGLDAAKPASPSTKDIYLAIDTQKLYFCYGSSTWTEYKELTSSNLKAILTALTTVTIATGDSIPILDVSDSGNLKIGLVSDIISGLMKFTDTRFAISNFTRDIATASGTQAVTGVGFTPKALILLGVIDGTTITSFGAHSATTGGAVFQRGSAGGFFASGALQFQTNSTPDQAFASVQSMDADGFTLSWTKQNSPTGTATIIYLALR